MKFLFKPIKPLLVLLLVGVALLLLQERQSFDIRTLSQIDPTPHTQELIDQKKYADANEYLSYFMQFDYVKKNPLAQEQMAHIQKIRSSSDYQSDKIIEGVIKGKSDEMSGQLAAIASDFLVIGDLRDLAIEGKHYFSNEKVDSVILALSTVGLIASASTIYSFGATTPVKGTLSLLKYAKRTNKLPAWLSQALVRESKVAKETKSLKNINALLEPITKLYEKLGLRSTLELLHQSKNLKELQGMLKLSKRFGKESPTLLKITKNQALPYAKAMPNIDKKTFLYASTYAERGLEGLKKLGKSKFITRTKGVANLSKTTYKGNLDRLFSYLLRTIPTPLLWIIVLGGVGYFLRIFFLDVKKIGNLKKAFSF